MSTILVDRVGSVVFHNGILRVDCVATGPNSEERPAGTLLIPANQAAAVLQALVGAAQELDRRLREQAQQTAAAGVASAAGPAEADTPAPADTKPPSRAGKK
jgi:hypothetical protein